MLQQIFDGQDEDGVSAEVEHWGGEVEVVVAGDLGGGTAALQAKYVGTDVWVPLSNGAWTEPEVRVLRTVRKCLLRMELANSSSPDLKAWI